MHTDKNSAPNEVLPVPPNYKLKIQLVTIPSSPNPAQSLSKFYVLEVVAISSSLNLVPAPLASNQLKFHKFLNLQY